MFETCEIWLENAEKTQLCGSSLANTLYGPVDIYLTGELGAGKTTFLNGLSTALGIPESTKSPTYALENRYSTKNFGEFIHIDLYRLSTSEAGELLQSSDMHQGIRCIEWANRLPEVPKEGIHIHIEDASPGRKVEVTFYDTPLITDQQMVDWRQEVALPEHIVRHCDAVATFSGVCVDVLLEQGKIVRKDALIAAARVHDLFRFVDFMNGAAHHPSHDPEVEPKEWEQIRQKYPGIHHEEVCCRFLQQHKLPLLAKIVRYHGLQLPPTASSTIEQKLLFYADKRVKLDKVVSLQERFEDFMQRYANGKWSKDGEIWLQLAQNIEKELFGLQPPG